MEATYNIKQMLNNTYEKYKNNIAYQIDNNEISYSKFIDDVNSLGTSLISLGLKNKKIGIIAENRYEYEVAYFSIMCGTGVVVPIDKSLPKEEIENIIKRADIDILFCSEKYICEYMGIKNIISMDLKQQSENILSQKELIEKGKDLIRNGNLNFINSQINNDDEAIIFFTSGTTDDSKAVVLSQKNICTNLNNVQKVYDINTFNCKDVVLSVLPLNHVLEGIFSLLLSISRGAKRIHCNDISNIAEYMQKYKVTFMANVPAVYDVIYDSINDEISKNINFLFCGGANLNTRTIEKYKEKNIMLLQGYGMTENSSAIALESKNNHKLGSCGKAIQEITIISPDENGIGELAINSDSVMKGYYKDTEKTNEVIDNGWLLTGDLAKIDEDGFVFICGRNKEIIVLQNGEKVSPKEIEDLINKIEIVKESIIFGKDNKIYAKIVSENDENTIWNEIQKINNKLPEYKQIKKIYVTNEPLERTSSGKIKRNVEITEESTILTKQNNIENRIKEIIAKQLDIDDIFKIKNEQNLISDLMADSLDKLAIISTIEKTFNIKIPKDNYAKLVIVEDLIKECEIIISKKEELWN